METTKNIHIDDLILEINLPYALDYRFRIRISGSYEEFKQPKPMRWVYGNIWNLCYHLSDLSSIKNPFIFQFKIDGGDSEEIQRLVDFYFSSEDISKWENALTVSSSVRLIFRIDCVWNSPNIKIQKKFVPLMSDIKALVVLGRKLKSDGKPSHILIGRMEKASKLFKEKFDLQKDFMLVTGGLVQRGEGVKTEAEVMRDLADSYGVPKSRIILEKQALSTVDNAHFSKAILHEMGINNITVMTSDFHMERSKLIFTRIMQKFNITFVEDNPKLSEKELNYETKFEKSRIPLVAMRLDGDGFVQ